MFELPESFDSLSAAELDAILAAVRDEATAITTLLEDAATAGDADLDRLEVLASAVEGINAAHDALAAVAQERADKAAAALARIAPAAPVEDVVEEVAEAEIEVTDAEIAEVVAEATAIVEDAPVAVVAAAPARMPSPRSVVARSPKANVASKPGVAIVAAGGVPGLRAGQKVESLADFVKPALQRWASYGGVNHAQDELFSLHAPARDPRLVANGKNDQDVMEYAASQARLKGANGEGILAAGGWCAPSEQMYDVCTIAALDGILDVPTISMPRGSISYFRQLDYSTVATAIAAGEFCFTNTELTAEPPLVKPCFEIPCAIPVEATLDACGLCLRAGLLQQKAFPELIAAWLELALIAHAHFLNARNISQIVAGSGAVQAVAGSFGAWSAFLDAVALKGTNYRLDNGMAWDSTLEIIAPFWAPTVFWTDHNRRQFGSEMSVGMAEITSKLAELNVRAQWVKDYSDAPFAGAGAVTVWPSAIPFVMYAPGAWVRGAEDIISVSTLVDSTLLQTNRVQLLFIETGQIMLPWCGPSINVSVSICPSGATSGPHGAVPGSITCPAP